MAVADEVVVKFEALIADYKAKVSDARTHFDRNADAIETRSKTMSDRVRVHSLAMATAIGSLVGGALSQLPGMLIRAGEGALEYASSLGETAQQLGVSAQALQEWRFIGGQVGIETEKMDHALGFFTKTMGQVQEGAKGPTKALADLGFNAQQIARISHQGADALPELADAFAKIKDPAERARIEVALFSRTGQQLDTALAGGRGQIDQLRDSVHKLGGVLSDEQIARADETADKLRALKDVLSARIAGAVADNAGAILQLANSLVSLVNQLGNAGRAYDNFMAKLHDKQAEAFAAIHTGFGPLSLLDTVGGLQGRNQAYIQSERQKAHEYRQRALGNAFQSTVTGLPGTKSKQQQDTPYTPDAKTLANVQDALTAKGAQTGGHTAEDAREKARRAMEILNSYLDEQNSLQQHLNSTLADIVGTDEARADAERRNIDLQEQAEERRIKANDDYSAAQKAALIKQNKINADKDKEAISVREATRMEGENRAVIVGTIQNERDLLQAQLELTTDRNERARIEKRLVDLANEEERIALNGVLSSKTASDAQKAIAAQRLAALNGIGDAQKQGIDKQNRSPGQAYLDELQTGLRNVDDTLQNMEVQQIKNLEDFLAGSTVKALGLHGALGQVADTLIRIGLQRGLIEPLANLLFGGGAAGGGGGLGGLLGALGGLFGGGTTPGGASSLLNTSTFSYRASGGPVRSGQPYVVGEKRPELFVPSTAGTILPSIGQSSSVEVFVTAGEYFDARVNRVTGPVIAKTSLRAAVGGSQLARQSLTNDALHRLD